MEIINISDKAAFDQLVKESTKPVMVDFWATWCGPCQMLSPIVEEVSAEYEDVDFYKVNVDEEHGLAMQFGIQSIPTLAFIKDDKTVDLSIGLISKEELIDFIRRNK